MPKPKKRKIPITHSNSSAVPVLASSACPASSKARTVIRRFHVLIKRQAQLQSQIHSSTTHGGSSRGHAAVARELEDIEREIAALGGLDAYQRMSIAGQGEQRGGGSEKVFIGWLKELGVSVTVKGKELESADGEGRYALLEVGALKPDNYRACAAWMAVTPIDLHAQHAGIIEQDFLLLDAEAHRVRWDAVSLSLVVNFVPDARDRGRMLKLAHTIIKPDGLLFLALPLPCVLNSRYLTLEHLRALMLAIGFAQVKERWRPGGKMAYWLFRKGEAEALADATTTSFSKKTVLKQGKDRNNFAILL